MSFPSRHTADKEGWPRPLEAKFPDRGAAATGLTFALASGTPWQSVGKLKSLMDGRVLDLAARCLLGRSPLANVQLQHSFTSSVHAKLSWTGSQWTIRDLGSRNGTFVGHKPLEAGGVLRLEAGAELSFGGQGDGEQWVLVDASAPEILATSKETGQVRAASALLALPSDEQPKLAVYLGPDGWVAEDQEGETRAIEDQAMLSVDGEAWRLDLPGPFEETPIATGQPSLVTAFFRFRVSCDEERVEITVVAAGKEHRLEPREHGYLLVTLARARLADAGLPPDEQGWRDRDELLKSLKLASSSLNVAILRARRQLAQIGFEDPAKIVEVRKRQRRLGTARFEVGTL